MTRRQTLPANTVTAPLPLVAGCGTLENLFALHSNALVQYSPGQVEDCIIEQVPECELNSVQHYIPHCPIVYASTHKGKASFGDCREKGLNFI